MKAHIGVDSKTKIIHSVVATAANGRRRNADASSVLDTTPASAAPMYVTGRSSEP